MQLPCMSRTANTSVGVDLTHAPSIPLRHCSRLPAELHHGDSPVELPHMLRLPSMVQGPIILDLLGGRLWQGRHHGGELRRCDRRQLLHLGAIVAAEARPVQVLIPANHGVSTVGHVVLLRWVRGILLEGEVREGEEVQPPNTDLEALIIDHGPRTLRITRCCCKVRLFQRDHEIGFSAADSHHLTLRLRFLHIGTPVATRRPLRASRSEGKTPLTDDLVPQAVHWKIPLNCFERKQCQKLQQRHREQESVHLR
mmetsp:Transcript_62320/g.135308  ORF Transcript_62320/g.135308 Transcript_62320/m.135308 type:complete len:254 (+) Transcript_62320:995-1756(+)